jgi:hypothetical protein
MASNDGSRAAESDHAVMAGITVSGTLLRDGYHIEQDIKSEVNNNKGKATARVSDSSHRSDSEESAESDDDDANSDMWDESWLDDTGSDDEFRVNVCSRGPGRRWSSINISCSRRSHRELKTSFAHCSRATASPFMKISPSWNNSSP